MKKIVLFLFFLLCNLTLFAQMQLNDVAKSKIKANAKNKWGSDWEMVKYEYDKQVEAGNEFFEIYNKYGCDINSETKNISDECLILIQAFAKWSDEGTGWVEWDMVLYETKEQLEAYQKMK